ncbi:MAG: adhesin [Methanobrevibacter sp.]|nr:adhesin [Methanobrevibacter sp.]
MIKKISMIVFIFLTIFFINTVSAAEIENGTILTEKNPVKEVNIISNDVDMFYKDGTRFSVEIQGKNEKPINNASLTFSINGVNYTRKSNENGKTSIPLNLNSGKYTIKTVYNENKSIYVNNTINIKSTIYSGDLTKIYRNSSQYQAKFINKNGEILKNTPVTFNINGVFYTRVTNDIGIARLNLNLEQGKYILTAMNPITGEMRSNNVTILPTITNNRDLVKYYRNGTQYVVTVIGKNGETIRSGETVEFNINGVFYYRQTNIQGQAKLNINLNPGDYVITAAYDGCRVSNNIKVLPTITANDMIMEYKDGSKFKAYVLDDIGGPKANDKVIFNINGVFYTRTTNEHGIASLNINLDVGTYIITSENNGLKMSNKIIIMPKSEKDVIKSTDFTYEIKIPNYVNVTYPYVYKNGEYTIKNGKNGILKMEKYQLFNIQIGYRYYIYSTNNVLEYGATYLGQEYYLLPFENGPTQHSYSLEELSGNGLIIHRSQNYTHFIYRNNCSENIEQFGVYIDKGLDKSETINYIQNGNSIVKINFQTTGFDELGLKDTLSKYHKCTIYDFNYKTYDEITDGNTDKIRFVNTNESVTLNYFGKAIAGYISEENIITKFNSKNCIEFEKNEMVTYGLSDKYKGDFDVLQSFAIINKKVSDKAFNDWISKESEYKYSVGMQSIYTMFLTSLNTAYLSDKLSDELSDDYGVKWSRLNNTVILGGMNWNNTYQHILTPNMGRFIEGTNESDIIKFNFVNSILLSKIEQYSLKPIAEDADSSITSVFDDIFNSLLSYKVTVVYYNNTAFISNEEGNSTFVIDLTSGIVTPLSLTRDFAYKGTTVSRDCGLCSITSMLKEVLRQSNNAILQGGSVLSIISDNIHPVTTLSIKGGILAKGLIGAVVGGSMTVGISVLAVAVSMQSIGVYYVENFVSDENLHYAYDHLTFTRPGYLQNMKVYNIPHENGSVDYVQVPILKNNRLDRDHVIYISNGKVKNLTRSETYKYFTEEYWDPFNVPRKYWR